MSQSDQKGYNGTPTDDRRTSFRQTYFDLHAFQRDILAAIVAHEGVPHGLAIKERLGEWYGEEINHGRLYPNLDELVERDLITKSDLDGRTNGYDLTEHGGDVLADGADHLDEVRPRPRYDDVTVDPEQVAAEAGETPPTPFGGGE
jgi:DNA-binding PadR family transcriptional regulator